MKCSTRSAATTRRARMTRPSHQATGAQERPSEASGVLFFQFLPEASLGLSWAPVAWWLGRVILALLVVAALLVEHFMPRSRHPRRAIACALLAAVAVTYVLAAGVRRLPPGASLHPNAFFPSPQQLLPGVI